MKPSDAPGFQKLLNRWNKILKETGFEDIEEMGKGGLQLKHSGTENRFRQIDQISLSTKARYYEIIQEKIVEITDEHEKKVLYLYSQGIPQSEIKARLGIKGHRWRVYKPIYKWLEKWGLKK